MQDSQIQCSDFLIRHTALNDHRIREQLIHAVRNIGTRPLCKEDERDAVHYAIMELRINGVGRSDVGTVIVDEYRKMNEWDQGVNQLHSMLREIFRERRDH